MTVPGPFWARLCNGPFGHDYVKALLGMTVLGPFAHDCAWPFWARLCLTLLHTTVLGPLWTRLCWGP